MSRTHAAENAGLFQKFNKKRRFDMMRKIEKRLVIAALVFVAIYLGAAAITIHTRITKEDRIERLESPGLSPAEGQLLIAELFLPFTILLTLTVCFVIVRKQRSKKLLKMQEEEAEEPVEPQIE